MNYSSSFVMSNGLDKCPRCGQNICEHTSVADVINLPNSLSQDFSTYSSDSSLIKQLFNDSNTNFNSNLNNKRISLSALSNQNNSNSNNQYLSGNILKFHQQMNNFYNRSTNINNTNYSVSKNITMNNCAPSYSLRPLSCQVMIIDNETTDKLLKEFFDCSNRNEYRRRSTATILDTTNFKKQPKYLMDRANESSSQMEKANNCKNLDENIQKTLNTNNKLAKKSNKKIKFSNLRLFLKSNKSTGNSTRTSTKFRPTGFVNCISSSSSSCEDIKSHSNKHKKPKSTVKSTSSPDHEENNQIVILNTQQNSDNNQGANKNELKRLINLNQSAISLNSKLTNELDNTDDYNEFKSIELCPIVASDIEEDAETMHSVVVFKTATCLNEEIKAKKHYFSTKTHATSSSSGNSSEDLNHKHSSDHYSSTTSATLTRPLLLSSSDQTISNNSSNSNDLNKGELENNDSKKNIENQNCNQLVQMRINDKRGAKNSAPIERMSNIIPQTKSFNYNLNDLDETKTFIMKSNKTISNRDKKRSSFFSTCSSCDTENTTKTLSSNDIEVCSSPKSKQACLKMSNASSSASSSSSTSSRCSSSSYTNVHSAKYHSISIIFILIGLFSLNSLQESFLVFYYFNTEQFYWFIYSLISLFSGQCLTLILSLLCEINMMNLKPKHKPLASTIISILSNDDQHNELYLLFRNPFSKLFLLVPGYLPICVYIQFFKHVFNYRKATGYSRFKLEFQLSLYLFFNALFHSLPLALINSCYLASISKSNSLTWYYTEFFSIFSFSTAKSFSLLLDDNNLERRNQLVLLIVSIFISISIGICLFCTYFELMKQMNYLTIRSSNSNAQTNESDKVNLFNRQEINQPELNSNESNLNEIENRRLEQSKFNLGLIEILVYFCYKFCLITSRLSIIAIFWYLFNEWLIVALLAHVIIIFLSTYMTNSKEKRQSRIVLLNMLSSNNKNGNSCEDEKLTEKKDTAVISNASSAQKITSKKSKLNELLTLFIICLISTVDLFMNQLSELHHIRKVLVYYILYFVQNFTVLTYWLALTILNANNETNNKSLSHVTKDHTKQQENQTNLVAILAQSSGIQKSQQQASDISSSMATLFSAKTYACYATLIYLCIILFMVFGLVLKFLHLHILRKRYRRLN
jgi:hypothetical protein